MFYSFSNEATQSVINFLLFIPLKLLAKILASAYDFAINIVMLINITITINKTHNIHDLIYSVSTCNFAVKIVMVMNM